jgi:phage baseplate assembly protein W
MSYDIKIAYACPHLIRNERVSLINGVLLSPRSPISGQGLLEIKRDGVLLSQSGNTSEAHIYAPQASPYRVKSNSNTLTLKTSEGDSYTYTLPSKTYKSSEIVSYFNKKLGVILLIEEGNTIKFTDNLMGVGFSISGTLLRALGFNRDKVSVRPRKVTPSWGLVKRLDGYDVLFSKPLTPEGLLEITYTADKRYCRRCASTGVENDLRWDDQGTMQIAEGADLLYQNIAKVILTKLGSNPFHPFYGSRVFDLIGRKSSPNVSMVIRETVTTALSKFQSQQRIQKQLQPISLEETLLRIESVTASQVGDDQTAYICNIVVRSASGQPVSVNLVFSVPGSIQLNGELT